MGPPPSGGESTPSLQLLPLPRASKAVAGLKSASLAPHEVASAYPNGLLALAEAAGTLAGPLANGARNRPAAWPRPSAADEPLGNQIP